MLRTVLLEGRLRGVSLSACRRPLAPIATKTRFHHVPARKPLSFQIHPLRFPPRRTFAAQSKSEEELREQTAQVTQKLRSKVEEVKEEKNEKLQQMKEDDYLMPHPMWSDYDVLNVQIAHHKPRSLTDWLSYVTIQTMRFNFDWMTGYIFKPLTYQKVIDRICFLETVAGVPGSIAATLRHLESLRRMKRDHGWIHTLLEEAENERMHLLTALQLKKPSMSFRAAVLVAQGVFYNFFFVAYLLSPTFCHRMVGYLEEEAVKTYTHIVNEIDNGTLAKWQTEPAPDVAKKYWHLEDNATVRDVMMVIRADEAHHRDTNHTFASIRKDAPNPFSIKKDAEARAESDKRN